MGSGGAIANAVADALGEQGSGVLSLPLRPDHLAGLIRLRDECLGVSRPPRPGK